jgi:hypothetical protein
MLQKFCAMRGGWRYEFWHETDESGSVICARRIR